MNNTHWKKSNFLFGNFISEMEGKDDDKYILRDAVSAYFSNSLHASHFIFNIYIFISIFI